MICINKKIPRRGAGSRENLECKFIILCKVVVFNVCWGWDDAVAKAPAINHRSLKNVRVNAATLFARSILRTCGSHPTLQNRF